MKLLLIGYGRHGKDTVAEIIHEKYNLKFISSSLFAAENIVYPVLKSRYSSVQECFDDRIHHRKEWYDLICDFNSEDPAKLARCIFEQYDMYVGMRSSKELQTVRNLGLVDFIIWVDASRRLPIEDVSSCTVSSTDADFIIDNNGTLEELHTNISSLWTKF
jgi:hypothetical protein